MQIQAALEGDLSGPELAHLTLLHAITCPMEIVFGSHIDNELVGQAVDLLSLDLFHGCLAAVGNLPIVALSNAGIGTIILAQWFDSVNGRLEQGKIIIGHGLASARGASSVTNGCPLPSFVLFPMESGRAGMPCGTQPTPADAPGADARPQQQESEDQEKCGGGEGEAGGIDIWAGRRSPAKQGGDASHCEQYA
ncbi:hypothetical protein GCM10027398_39480 [Azotobacter salinestris]